MGDFRSGAGGIPPDDAVDALVAAMNTPGIGGRLMRMSFEAAASSRHAEDRRRARLRSLQFFEHAIGVPAGKCCRNCAHSR